MLFDISVAGHDSNEDAISCLQLMQYKLIGGKEIALYQTSAINIFLFDISVAGHDSNEDAISCLQLMQYKLKEDARKEGRR